MNDTGAIEWERLLERAAERGAQVALKRIGLDSKETTRDIDEFRSVMSMWRDLRQEAYRTTVRWIVMAAIALLVFAVSPKLSILLKGN